MCSLPSIPAIKLKLPKVNSSPGMKVTALMLNGAIKPVELILTTPYLARQLSVFFISNTIYGAGRQITSLVVAQDAGNKTQSLDRFRPSGRGNTIRYVCDCVYLMLGCGEVCFAEGFYAMYC